MEHLDLLSERYHPADGRTSAISSRSKRILSSGFRRRLRSGRFSSVIRTAAALLFTLYYNWVESTSVYASGDIKGSKLVTGTEKLIGDVTTWLMILAPVVSGLLIVYFSIRRSAADEMDTKKWNNRIIVAIVSCIGAVLGAATLNIIIGYYK
ncbi:MULTISPECIES: Mbov_0395 family pilin-like conjugal transfer protein [Paenibacillus]|uniref:Mbov_0395 family pilin-like conjugal transfer protein n=1 Tax=Paenibacillus TaxID=44249 RepID=UPI002115FA20|nr:hypothetical protein [Paenibacillus odorifer]